MICNKCAHFSVCKNVKIAGDFEQKVKELKDTLEIPAGDMLTVEVKCKHYLAPVILPRQVETTLF